MRMNHRMLVTGGALLAALAALSAGCGSSGGSTGGGGAGGGAGGGDPATLSCEAYCTTITKNCVDAQSMYVSKDVCLTACKTFPVGKASDTEGNTLGCRTYHAGAAADGPVLHCPHAGPGGADYCGSNCDGYCNLAMSACPSIYTSETDCLDTCKTFTTTGMFSASVVTGNTLECRLYHASVATSDAATHCAHIGTMPSAGTCTDP